MKKIYLLSTVVALLFAACASETTNSKKAVISGVIENSSEIKQMMLVNMDRQEQDSIAINEDGTFRVEVDASVHHLFTLFHNQDILEVYLTPGETLEVVTDAKDFMGSPLFKGSAAEEAELMNKKLTITTAVAPQELIQMSPTEFMTKMDEIIVNVNTLIDGADVSKDLKELLKTDAFFTLLPLREGYSQRKKQEIAQMDTTQFYAYRARIKSDLTNEDNLESTAFKMHLLSHLQSEIMNNYQKEMNEAGDRWIIVMLEKIPSIIENVQVRDYCYQLLYRNMMMGRMVQMPVAIVDDVVSTYKEMVTNKEFEKDIDAEYDAYQIYKKKSEEEAEK